MTRSCWNHSTKFEEKIGWWGTPKWSRKSWIMLARPHRGGRKPWIYTISLHPLLGIQNMKLMAKRQFSLIQFMLHGYIRRKTSAFLNVFTIMLQITCSDAIETKQLWKWNSPLLSNLDKIGFRYAKQDFSKSLKIYCRYLCSQQQARTKRYGERP